MDHGNSKHFNKYLLYKKKYLKKKMSKMSGGSSKNELMLFKSDRCPHCVNFFETWNNITSDTKLGIKFTTFDSVKHMKEIQEYNISGFPTILYKVNNELIEYVGNRDENSVKEFIKSYL